MSLLQFQPAVALTSLERAVFLYRWRCPAAFFLADFLQCSSVWSGFVSDDKWRALNPPQSIFSPPLGTRGYEIITWVPRWDACICSFPSDEVHLVVFTQRCCQRAIPHLSSVAFMLSFLKKPWPEWSKMTFLTCFEVSATLVSLRKVSYAAVFSFSDSQAHHRSTAPLIGACRISHRSPSTALMRSSLMPEVGVAFLPSPSSVISCWKSSGLPY